MADEHLSSDDLSRSLTEIDDRELNRIDSALSDCESATDLATALAAFARATEGINTFPLAAVGPASLTLDEILPPDAMQTYSAYAILPWHRRHDDDPQTKWEQRLQKYWAVVQKIVERFGPDQYQIGIGPPPQVVMVSFVWNHRKKSDAAKGASG